MSHFRSIQSIKKLTQQQFQQRFEYNQLLDSGTYGIVAKYFDKQLNKHVAVKQLKDSQGLSSFQNQQQIMNKVHHQNVLSCIGLFYNTNKNTYLLITPFCNKKNIRQNIKQIVKLQQKIKIWICLQIIRGLHAMHQLNIMHRDIKPANILLEEGWKVKLCDFGFGKQDQQIRQSVKVGTPLYRDPNIQFGNYSKKCDIYSVGLVYDTIFRGQCCLKDIAGRNLAQQIIYFNENKKNIINKLKCDQQIKTIILKCLQRNQNNRYSSKQLLNKMQQIWKKMNPQQHKKMIEQKQKQQILQQINQSSIIQNKNESINNSVQNSLFQSLIRNQKNQNNLRKFNVMIEQNNKKNDLQYDVMGDQKVNLNRMNTQFYENSQANILKQQDVNINLFTSYAQINPNNAKKQKTTPLKALNISPKKRSSIIQQQKYNFLALLLKSKQVANKNIQKCQNFKTVYQFFLNHKYKIRQIQKQVMKLQSIRNTDKKVLLFIVLFGYLRFIKLHKNYLTNKKSSIIQNILNISVDKLTKITIQKSLDLLSSQLQIIINVIKPIISDLNTDKVFYKEVLTPNIHKMISDGIQKKFLQIQKDYTSKQIRKQFQEFVLNQRYHTIDNQQNVRKLKVKEMGDIF